MHIYDKFVSLCEAKGVDEVTAYNEIPINKGTISLWRTAKKNGEAKIPSPKIAMKMSEYFQVPVSYILGESGQKEKPTLPEEGELDSDTMELLEAWNSSEEAKSFLLSAARMIKSRREEQ